MMEYTRGARVAAAAGHGIQGGGRARTWSRACMASALAAPLLAGLSTQAVAQLELNRAYAGCVLTGSTVSGLLTDLGTSGIAQHTNGSPEVAFVVVYALNNDNDGQPATVRGTRGFTGPVICRNQDVTGIANTTQTTRIPASGTVNVLDVEDVFILRYVLNGPANAGTREKVICHTVDANTDCFRISPLLP